MVGLGSGSTREVDDIMLTWPDPASWTGQGSHCFNIKEALIPAEKSESSSNPR